MIRSIFKEGFAKRTGIRNIKRVYIRDNGYRYSFPGFVLQPVKKNERTS